MINGTPSPTGQRAATQNPPQQQLSYLSPPLLQYENQIFIFPSWTTRMMPRPKFSDITGRLKLPKYCFDTPSGWLWDDDWFIQPAMSNVDEPSTLMTFTEDVFENVTRQPGALWTAGEVVWTNVVGEEALPKDEITCPPGWQWTDSWQIDLSRAVDEVGFEYCVDHNVGGFVPVEKTYHLYRRRRWVRNRERTNRCPGMCCSQY
eukprot:sb/3470525/